MKKKICIILALLVTFLSFSDFTQQLSGKSYANAEEVTNSSSAFLKTVNLGFTPTDTVLDPVRPIEYMTDLKGKKVYSVNYETGEIKSIQFSLPTERLAFANDEIYVTLLKMDHQYWTESKLSGAIGIIDSGTFTIKDQFDIDTDPFDIEADSDNIYVSPGSNQWQDTNVYSIKTKTKAASVSQTYFKSYIVLQPGTQRFYLTDAEGSSVTITEYQLSNGEISKLYHLRDYDIEDITLNKNMRISPDGKYLFNGSGVILKCGDSQSNDITYVNKLDSSFSDVAFDLKDNLVFTSTAISSSSPVSSTNSEISVYDYNTFSRIGNLHNDGEVNSLYYKDGKLIIVDKMADGTFQLKTTDLSSNKSNLEVYNPSGDNGMILTSGYIPVCLNKCGLLQNPSITLKDSSGKDYYNKCGIFKDVLYVFYKDVPFNTKVTLTVKGGSLSDYSRNVLNTDYSQDYTTPAEYTRLSGNNRYGTCAGISKFGWDKSDYIVVARGDDFPDALCATPLAAKYAAPILLTLPNKLDSNIDSEINRLKPKKAFIIGGTGAISTEVENAIRGKGIDIQRISGATRYETSVEIAKYLGNRGTAFVVTGNNYPDALSIASYAAKEYYPILLTQYSQLPSGVSNYIKSTGINKAYVIGGSGVVSDSVVASLPLGERVAGDNRYQTNISVFAKFDLDFTNAFIATGNDYADALSGSSLAGLMGSPIILVDPNMDSDAIYTLNSIKGYIKTKVILGGSGAVPQSIVDKIFK